MSESRAPVHKVVGKTSPILGEIVVRRTHGKEHYALDGTPYPSPRLEERLIISVERHGIEVGWAQVAVPPAPDPNATPPRSADDATIAAEIAIDGFLPIVPGWDPPLAPLDGLPVLLVDYPGAEPPGAVLAGSRLVEVFRGWGTEVERVELPVDSESGSVTSAWLARQTPRVRSAVS